MIQVELPDPDEDDNRIITGLTMEEIARSIGDKLPRYLRESGIPEDRGCWAAECSPQPKG